MTIPGYVPKITEEHLDLICKTIPLKKDVSRKALEDYICFGPAHFVDDDSIISGMRMSDANEELRAILDLLKKVNGRIDQLDPLLRIFLFKYPAGMSDKKVKEWFGPKIVTAGDRTLTTPANYTDEELFFRSIYYVLCEGSKTLQDFFEAAVSAPLSGRRGGRQNGRRMSCVVHYAWAYQGLTGKDARDKLSYYSDTNTYESPFLRFMQIMFDIIEPDHGMDNLALGHLIRTALGPKRRNPRRRPSRRHM